MILPLVLAACSLSLPSFDAIGLRTRLEEIGRGPSFVYAWSTSRGDWDADRFDSFRRQTGVSPLLYFAEFRDIGGTWYSPEAYARYRAGFAATVRRQWAAHRAVPLVTWHIQNPYVPPRWKDARYGGDCGMRYRHSSPGYPPEHRCVMREIASGAGSLCGTGRIDGVSSRAFANPREWYLWCLRDVAAFCRTLVDDDGRRIPIVFRPFHEMDGSWFWWCADSATADDFIAVFRLTVEVLRRELGPENVLFAYGADRCWKADELGAPGKGGFLNWYPGDEFVDLVGYDDYSIGKGKGGDTTQTTAAAIARLRVVSDFARAHGKVCGLFETGALDSSDDFYSILHRIATADGVNVAIVTTYDGIWTFPKTEAGKADMRRILSRPDVLTSRHPYAADPTRLVNPFIGTQRLGSSHPGATWPMGMVQPGPEVGAETPPPSGYRYGETLLQGFTQNRVMGTFWGCLHDVLLLPFTGADPAFAKMDKASERAEPGYYAVRLPDSGVRCELTCSERVAYHRYTFENGGTGRILVDLGAGPLSTWGGARSKPPRVVASSSAFAPDGILSGHNVVKCNWPDRDVFFALAFSRPWSRVSELPPRADGSPAKRYVVEFDLKKGDAVVVKAALSSVDEAGARANLASDPADFDFAARRRAAHDAWAGLLGRVEAEGSFDRRTVLMTMLYQAYVQPQRMDDADGRVRLAKDRVVRLDKPFFTGFLDTWDTFRAAHPLYTVLTPARAGLFAESLLAYPRHKCGGIPSNAVFGRACCVMPGSHGIPIVADTFLKGLLPGFSAEEVFAALDRSTGWYDQLVRKGWNPLDPGMGCGQNLVAQLDDVVDAGAICTFSDRTGVGRERVARFHRIRADSWTNVYDAATGAMRPRNSKGDFVGPEPFDFFRQGLSAAERRAKTPWGFNEGGYAQWAWHVLGDPQRLVALHGGPEKAAADLDRIFKTPTSLPGQQLGYGCTGPVGQYFHGNEPTHHVPYYYMFAGRPDRTQEVVREICTKLYRNAPDGMCGDGDSGQMGAWYVFSSMGFYPFSAVGGDYVLGAPQYPRLTLRLENGRRLTVTAKGLSDRNLHVKSVTFNGAPVTGVTLSHAQLLTGGELVFEMIP